MGVRALAKRVSADTITQITGAATFREQEKASPPPTTADLIEKTRERLAKEVAAMQAFVDAADPENERTIEARTKDLVQAQSNQQLFETLLKDVPTGFRLEPTFYSRITMQENDAIREEYSYHVRPRFLKFVGENYADDLRALGIAEEGIERMKSGLDPEDRNGHKYNLNVDHIIERAGSGTMGKTKSADPDSMSSKPVFNINHFGNFVLLPEPVHEYKNMLNDLQVASDMPWGKGKWILMMVPERTNEHAGFVAQPQPKTSKLKGLSTNPPGQNHSQYIVEVTLGQLADMKDTGNIRTLVRELIVEADAGGKTVAETADIEARQKKGGLRKKFNDAVAKDPEAAAIIGMVRPALDDVTQNVSSLFRRVSRSTSSRNEKDAFWEFVRFFRSPEVKNLKLDAEALPLPESAEMLRTFRQIEQDMKAKADQLDAEGKAARVARGQSANDDSFKKKPFKKPFRNGGSNSRVNRPGQR